MTDEEIIDRMRVIHDEIKKLKEEYNKGLDYFKKKKEKELMEAKKRFIGKYFVLEEESNINIGFRSIKAFKIIDFVFSDIPTSKCLILEKDESQIKSIKVTFFNPWQFNEDCSNWKVIDFYEEINKEEFEKLFNEYSVALAENI